MFDKKKKQVAKLVARSLDHLNERLDQEKIGPGRIIAIHKLGKNLEIYYVEDIK